jgi:hypothetical protein
VPLLTVKDIIEPIVAECTFATSVVPRHSPRTGCSDRCASTGRIRASRDTRRHFAQTATLTRMPTRSNRIAVTSGICSKAEFLVWFFLIENRSLVSSRQAWRAPFLRDTDEIRAIRESEKGPLQERNILWSWKGQVAIVTGAAGHQAHGAMAFVFVIALDGGVGAGYWSKGLEKRCWRLTPTPSLPNLPKRSTNHIEGRSR